MENFTKGQRVRLRGTKTFGEVVSTDTRRYPYSYSTPKLFVTIKQDDGRIMEYECNEIGRP